MNEALQQTAPALDPVSKSWKAVYTIVENQAKGGNRDRKYWLRVGIAFPNRDGSLNVRLDAMPVNGMLQIRDMPTPDEAREQRGRRDDQAPQAHKGAHP